MAGDRAIDILSELKPRARLCERLLAKVGRRGWERARVSVSARIFKVYRLQDPWDPNSPSDGLGNGLSAITQRLTDDKRQPAPHALPKEEKKKPLAPNVPPAKAGPAPAAEPPRPPPSLNRTPTTAPKPTDRPPTPAAPVKGPEVEGRQQLGYIPKTYAPKKKPEAPAPPPKPTTPTANPFGRPDRPGLVGKLPMRPEVASSAVPVGPTPPGERALPVHPPRNSGSAGGRAEIARRPPPPPLPRGTVARGAGRLTLGAATVVVVEPQDTLEITELAPTAPPTATASASSASAPVAAAPPAMSIFDEPAPASPPPTPKPVNRAPPKGKDGMDDLFAASLDAGRLRMGRAKATAVATPVEAEEKPKRVPVALPKAVLPSNLPKPKADEPG